MNMRYGSSLNPNWMLDALWRKRKVIFFAISAVSLAGNAVVLAESLGIHKTFMSLLSRLLLQLRDGGEFLVQRPVLYMLLNLIMLGMVVKSGMLGGCVSKPVHEAEIDKLGDTSVPICENFDDHPEAHAHEQTFITSVSSMKRRASVVLFSYTEPALNSNVSFEQGVAGKSISRAAWQPKQASLFTIEPLDSSIEPPSNTLLSSAQIVGAAQIMGAAQPPSNTLLSSAQIVGAAQLEMANPHTAQPIMYARHLAKEPQIGFPPVSLDGPLNGVSPVSHKNSAPDHRDDSERPDDYDLNRQEFNERVETFITKFKRNLTMQRQESFNRLLGLVGMKRS